MDQAKIDQQFVTLGFEVDRQDFEDNKEDIPNWDGGLRFVNRYRLPSWNNIVNRFTISRWLTDTSVICKEPMQGSTYKLKIETGETLYLEFLRLLPKCVYAFDGQPLTGMLVFYSIRADEPYLAFVRRIKAKWAAIPNLVPLSAASPVTPTASMTPTVLISPTVPN